LAASGLETEGPVDCNGLVVSTGLADIIDMTDGGLENVFLDGCLINCLRVDANSAVNVTLRRCLVGKIEGAASEAGVPFNIQDCEIGEFENTKTNAAIMRSDLTAPVKVMLTIIRKLFLQRGSGRIESAFSRGLDGEHSHFVLPILQCLASEGVIFSHPGAGNRVWHGNRTARTRAIRMLEVPVLATDDLFKTVEEMR
jgi:hypothetical protein